MKSLYILDLDRTCFDTHRFAHDIIAALAAACHFDEATFTANMSQFVRSGEIGYDFYNQAQTVTGLTTEQINQIIAAELGATDYTYSDVAPWLKRHHDQQIIIVTVGEPDYQQLKLHHAASLKALPHTIVGEDKGMLLRRTLEIPSSSGASHPTAPKRHLNLGLPLPKSITIVDDNPHTFTSLGPQLNLTQIYMSRPGEKYSGQAVPAYVSTVTSFEELA